MQICVPRRDSAFWQQRPSSTTVTIITTVIVLPGECCRKQGQLDHLTLTALSEWAAMRRQAYLLLDPVIPVAATSQCLLVHELCGFVACAYSLADC